MPLILLKIKYIVDTPTKDIVDSLNNFFDIYKFLEETTILIVEKHLVLVVQMH